MNAEQWSNLFVNAAPFLLYGALLFKLYSAWRRVRSMEDRCRETRLAAVLLLLTVCTLTFMAANAYALEVYGKTFLSLRVFQMFVLSNCAAYWLVLDLITKDACE
ncbi:hypothetical protein N5E86_20555 [Stutzerimonas stutzeri]|uniref:hypothetical protein n=1 Tax=Stutzerimonas stutzeri TaxID=316 RepID=UPI002447D8D2|nr:hypothetical protein [Stutzerimonas stutzeri]MDH1556844.1 hypothetical protein [Stutzerimonas stutzeri]